MRATMIIDRLPPQMRTVLAGLGAYASAEAATRIVRLVVILIVARQVDAAMLGLAALALSMFEIVRVLANAGIGQRIVAANEGELAQICNTAHRLFWSWCSVVALVQLSVAGVLWLGFDNREAAMMLAALAVVYPIMPPGLVQVFLLMRDQRLGTTARIAATQTMLDHGLTLLLVLAWPSAWAIVLPKILTAPVWTILCHRAMHWAPTPASGYAPIGAFRRLAPAVLASEFIAAARMQADKLIIGALFGVETLGLYYFAFNAGLGITQSFVSAFGIVAFPQLCRAGSPFERRRQLRQVLIVGGAIFGPVVILQGLLAPIYVPLVFGETWRAAAPYVALLSLAALPLLTAAALGAYYRASDEAPREAVLGAAATLASLAALTVAASISLAAACAAFAAALALVFFPAALVVCVGQRSTAISVKAKEYLS